MMYRETEIDAYADRIKGFLEKFQGEKDVVLDMEEMDLNDQQDAPRVQHLKYMNQLVSLNFSP